MPYPPSVDPGPGQTYLNTSAFGTVGDGIHDDTAAIQSAINAAQNAGGGVVFFPVGIYLISSTLNITADNVRLEGAGRGTQILASNGFPAAQMIYVQGPGGAGVFRYGIRIAHIQLKCTVAAGVTGIQFDSTYWAEIHNVDVEGVYATSIYLNGASNAFGAYTDIDHCHLGVVPGGTTSGGIGILTNNHEFNTVRVCTLNWFSQAGGIGIKLQNGNNVIHGVTFDECDTGLHCYFTHNDCISNCQFDRGITRFIRLQGCTITSISNNFFGVFSGSGTKNMIDVDNSSNASNIITGSNVQAGTGWTNFVVEAAGTGSPANIYANNIIGSYGVTRINGIFRNNQGYNPNGSLTTPAVPASTAVYTNGFGVDCTVFVTGGTVTVVSIGGTATGLTSGAFRVLAGQTIALTYSSSPSWTWFGD